MGVFDRISSAARAAAEAFLRPDVPAVAMADFSPSIPTKRPTGAYGLFDPVGIQPPLSNKFPMIMGPSMTPAAVSSALRLAEQGYMWRYCDLLSELREKIPHLQAVLATREGAITACVRRGKWTVTPAETKGARATAKASTIADYVTYRLRGLPGFADAVNHLSSGIYYGRSAAETIWARDSDGLYPRELVGLHAKRLSYANTWDIHLWDQDSDGTSDPSVAAMPGLSLRRDPKAIDKFIVHAPQTVAGEYPTRQGLGRSIVFIGAFLLWDYREWMKYAELFASPWRIGYFDKAPSDAADVSILEQALQMLGVNSVAALPAGARAELVSPKMDKSIHEALRSAFNAEISKVVLHQTSTTELGDTGSYAATKVSNEVRQEVTETDVPSMNETLTRDLIEPMVRRTFGADAARTMLPRLNIIGEPEEDRDAAFTRFQALVSMGVSFDADEAREHWSSLSKPAPGAVTIGGAEEEEENEPASASDPTKVDPANRADKADPAEGAEAA